VDVNALRDYGNWVGKSAEEVRASVKQAGGWGAVFSGSVPLWAHRVRNYFNEEPTSLTRYDDDTCKQFLARVQEGLNRLDLAKKAKFLKQNPMFKDLPEVKAMPDPPPGTPDLSTMDDIGETFALSDYVYKDQANHTWYQMSPGATIYHWGRDPIVPSLEALIQTGGQATIPVFKLVSPDGTGGSSETIIENPQDRTVTIGIVRSMIRTMKVGRIAIGDVGKPEQVANRIVTDLRHQGSYNYAETVRVGLAAHRLRDVQPHEKHPSAYVNPPNRFTPLALRLFPEKGDASESDPLAKQQ
jgi:hypothetical protein